MWLLLCDIISTDCSNFALHTTYVTIPTYKFVRFKSKIILIFSFVFSTYTITVIIVVPRHVSAVFFFFLSSHFISSLLHESRERPCSDLYRIEYIGICVWKRKEKKTDIHRRRAVIAIFDLSGCARYSRGNCALLERCSNDDHHKHAFNCAYVFNALRSDIERVCFKRICARIVAAERKKKPYNLKENKNK